MSKFYCELKKYRQIANLTQEQLAEIVGVRRETIVHIEHSRYNPSLKLAIDIAKAVNEKIENIFFYESEEK